MQNDLYTNAYFRLHGVEHMRGGALPVGLLSGYTSKRLSSHCHVSPVGLGNAFTRYQL